MAKGWKMTLEQRKRVSDSHKGIKPSLETRKKLSEIRKKRKVSEQTCKRISDSKKGKKRPYMKGEKHPLWKGGYEYKLFQNRLRKSQKRSNGGSHSFGEWITLKAQYNYTCPMCGLREPSIKLTQDHIISLAKGGCDSIQNIQPLCGVCNSRKGSK